MSLEKVLELQIQLEEAKLRLLSERLTMYIKDPKTPPLAVTKKLLEDVLQVYKALKSEANGKWAESVTEYLLKRDFEFVTGIAKVDLSDDLNDASIKKAQESLSAYKEALKDETTAIKMLLEPLRYARENLDNEYVGRIYSLLEDLYDRFLERFAERIDKVQEELYGD